MPETKARKWRATSYIGRGEPDALARVLESDALNRPVQSVLDLGCGAGGLSRFVARKSFANIYSLDASLVALEMARRRRHNRQVLICGDFLQLPMLTGSMGAAFSWDGIYLVQDRAGALRELARVLRPHSRFIFTSYETADNLDRTHEEWKVSLDQSGFRMSIWSDRSVQWRIDMRAKHEARLAAEDWLISQDGPEIAAELAVSRAMLGLGGDPSFLACTSRIWVEAVRR
jgi:SAM-dependent methyltransferase